jgi:glutathione S-transferase
MSTGYHKLSRTCNIAAIRCNSPAQKPVRIALGLVQQPRRRRIVAQRRRGAGPTRRETPVLRLYFWPMACSLASRIALMEAGIEARYHLVHLWTKKVMADDSDFRAVSLKGAVPVLVLENGERLSESAAVLQYIADLRPELALAPSAGHPDRYRLQEWLSFVGAEIHKAFLFPTFWYRDDAAKASARERIGGTIAIAAEHLAGREFLVGNRFTVADAHLTWALLLLGRSGVDLAQWPSLVDYLARMQARPQVKAAIETEMQLWKSLKPQLAKPAPTRSW